MLPESNPVLEKFFGSLRIIESQTSSDADAYFELIPASYASNKEGQLREAIPILASYDPSCGLTPESAIQRLSKELAVVGHFAEDGVVRVFLALFVITERADETAVSCLNNLIQSISEAEVSQYQISPFPAPQGFQSFMLDDFQIGPLEYDRLVYWCERVKCDYFIRYPRRHLGHFAIQRSPLAIWILDIPSFGKIVSGQLTIPLIDLYYDAVTRCLLDRFRNDLWTAQEILIAMGAPFIEFNNPREWAESTFIGVFRNVGTQNGAYFCPIGQGLSIDYAQIDKGIPATQSVLHSSFDFVKPGKHEIGETLHTFCRFVAKGRLHEGESRVSEAFLHYVISLDLLFGDRHATTEKVVERAAVCVYGDTASSYQQALKQAKELYNLRSRYVHAGKHVTSDNLEVVKSVCKNVLHCLLRLHSITSSTQEQQKMSWWHSQLDFIVCTLDAGRKVSEEDLQKLGLRDPDISPRSEATVIH